MLWASVAAAFAPLAATQEATAKRANELTLARLRPGHSSLANANSLYGEKHRLAPSDDGRVWTWIDPCAKRKLRLEADEQGLIQTLTVSSEDATSDCRGRTSDPAASASWKTGKGLSLGDPKQKVSDLYGPANSISPSVRGARELELFFYAFDWAGSDVPQVMEVTCDRTSGLVVEITLAFPSL